MSTRIYLVNRATAKRYRLNGIQPTEQLPAEPDLKKIFSDYQTSKASILPATVDLRPYMTPVENQSKTACCVANALAGACEYLLKRHSGENIDLSRLFIYYNARLRGGHGDADMKDTGCTVTSAVEALKESGVCLESIWTYDTTKINERPPDAAYAAAKEYCIDDAFRLKSDLLQMKSCLALGFPFIFGLRMYKSFDRAAKAGLVPMPKKEDQNRTTHRTHSMLAAGYDDQKKVFIVRNSWGEQWGDHGYCYIPYDYVADAKYSFAPWTVRLKETNTLSLENRFEEDSILLLNIQDEHECDSDDDDNRTIEEVDEDDYYEGNDEGEDEED